jgi:hypothetical protein
VRISADPAIRLPYRFQWNARRACVTSRQRDLYLPPLRVTHQRDLSACLAIHGEDLDFLLSACQQSTGDRRLAPDEPAPVGGVRSGRSAPGDDTSSTYCSATSASKPPAGLRGPGDRVAQSSIVTFSPSRRSIRISST